MNIGEYRDKFIKIFNGYEQKLCDDCGSYPQYYQAFPFDKISAIHYELIQHTPEEPIFLEFHIERSHYRELENFVIGYIALFEKPENYRDCELTTRYSSLFWKMRRPIFTLDDFEKDAKRLKEIILSSNETVKAKEIEEIFPVCIRNEMPIEDVLDLKLRVPEYQRSYCWEKKNVLRLLNDIAKWQQKHEGQLYHIGTIVLKEVGTEKTDVTYDIIDGQQRLLTLALTLVKQKEKIPKISLGKTNVTKSAKYHLQQARNTIDRWYVDKWHDGINLAHLCVSVIIIGKCQSEDLAFLFFNHLNSSGKRLDDYDLLKSHHLRFLANDVAGLMAKKWDKLDRNLKHKLLHNVLFRLRNWMDVKSFSYNADILESHELFRNFTLDYEPMPGLCTPYQPYRLNSILASGLEFFNYIEQYEHRLEEFEKIECIQSLEINLGGHSYGTLYWGIFALSFLFYCKFGEYYLKEAVFAITYKVSELRNEVQVRRHYIAQQPVFSYLAHLIDKATHEAEFLGKALNDDDVYSITNRGGTATSYWKDVCTLCEKEFLSSPHIASYVKNFVAVCNEKPEDK